MCKVSDIEGMSVYTALEKTINILFAFDRIIFRIFQMKLILEEAVDLGKWSVYINIHISEKKLKYELIIQ